MDAGRARALWPDSGAWRGVLRAGWGPVGAGWGPLGTLRRRLRQSATAHPGGHPRCAGFRSRETLTWDTSAAPVIWVKMPGPLAPYARAGRGRRGTAQIGRRSGIDKAPANLRERSWIRWSPPKTARPWSASGRAMPDPPGTRQVAPLVIRPAVSERHSQCLACTAARACERERARPGAELRLVEHQVRAL